MDRLFILAEYHATRDLEELVYSVFEELCGMKIKTNRMRQLVARAVKAIMVVLDAVMLAKLKATFGEYFMGLQRTRVNIRAFLLYRLVIEPLVQQGQNKLLQKHPQIYKYARHFEKAFGLGFLLFTAPISLEHLVSGPSVLQVRQQQMSLGGIGYVYNLLWPTALTGTIHGLLDWSESMKKPGKASEWHQLSLNTSPKVQLSMEGRGACTACSKQLLGRAFLLPNAYAYCSQECMPRFSSKFITLHL